MTLPNRGLRYEVCAQVVAGNAPHHGTQILDGEENGDLVVEIPTLPADG